MGKIPETDEKRDWRRLRVEIHGAVQGVGFRPFVFRLATGLHLTGWVRNDIGGVLLEVEGDGRDVETFLRLLKAEPPPRARIEEVHETWLEPAGGSGFEIVRSEAEGEKTALVLPDVATCPDCLGEILDPGDRRFRYPFGNCTNCGPRFTILRALPYDRPNTTMAAFRLCPACRAEYGNPSDRRFHAQPVACPACGPRLTLHSADGRLLASEDSALLMTARELANGRIAAVKGLGGFHLMCDARDSEAVGRLRERKARQEKPFALMVRDLAMADSLCELPAEAANLLSGPEAPILLLRKREAAPVAPEVAPGNPWLGVMLPATPLHHLLLRQVGFPLVATSGNRSEEPICTDEGEARGRLGGMADLFLVHDRPIERHADDSIVRVGLRVPRLMRRARGWAPLPVLVSVELPKVLAVGAHMKTTVALSAGRRVFLSQHIGDLETPEAMAAFEKVIADFLRLYEVEPAAVAHDLHPDYPSTRWALESGRPLIGVQHHHAHLASCLAENGEAGPALGVTWDGTGYGTDGTVWGGEFLLGDAAGFTRVAHFLPFRLPGGEAAVREPRRVALAVLEETLGEAALSRDDLLPVASFSTLERDLLGRMLERGLNSPVTTSAGRLFDAVSALLGLRQKSTFEGQAAMELEWAADPSEAGAYALPLVREASKPAILDWRPLVGELLRDLEKEVPAGTCSARFHNALAAAIVDVAEAVGERKVALTGGCFQNALLLERTASRLTEKGFRVLLHREVPPNDGGISLGQVMVAAARLARQGRTPSGSTR